MILGGREHPAPAAFFIPGEINVIPAAESGIIYNPPGISQTWYPSVGGGAQDKGTVWGFQNSATISTGRAGTIPDSLESDDWAAVVGVTIHLLVPN